MAVAVGVLVAVDEGVSVSGAIRGGLVEIVCGWLASSADRLQDNSKTATSNEECFLFLNPTGIS